MQPTGTSAVQLEASYTNHELLSAETQCLVSSYQHKRGALNALKKSLLYQTFIEAL